MKRNPLPCHAYLARKTAKGRIDKTKQGHRSTSTYSKTNARWGFSLDEAKSSTAARYENLLLIGVLATFSVWLIGNIKLIALKLGMYCQRFI